MSLTVYDNLITLDLYHDMYVITNVSQYDFDSRKIYIEVASNGQKITFDSTTKAHIKFVKPDGTIILNDCSITSDNYVLIDVTDQMCAVAGKCTALLYFTDYSSSSALHSMKFYVRVLEDIVDSDYVVSKDEFQTLEQALVTAESTYDNVMEYTNVKSLLSESWAIGGTGMREDEDTNNSKYYAEQSGNNVVLSREWAIGLTETTEDPTDENNSKYWSDRAAYLLDSKADKTVVNGCINSVVMDDATGIFTITFVNGTTATIDTKLEKIAINFKYDAEKEQLIITLDDGTIQYVDLSTLISEYDFSNTDTIAFSQTTGEAGDKVISAIVVEGSIKEKHLDPNYLVEIKDQVKNAADQVTNAKSWAIGGTGTRTDEDIDNAKYYSEQSNTYFKASSDSALASANYATLSGNSSTNASNSATKSSTYATNSANSATESSNYATASANSAKLSESYAIGGTGTRSGENYDNAKFYYENAKAVSGVDIATTSVAGLVKPDGTTITITADGTISGVESENIIYYDVSSYEEIEITDS